MELTIFILLGIITLLSLFLGYNQQYAHFIYIGWAFWIILSFIMLFGNIQYSDGFIETTNYTYNSINQTNQTITNHSLTKQDFNDNNSHLWGLFLIVSGAAGLFLTIYEVKENNA